MLSEEFSHCLYFNTYLTITEEIIKIVMFEHHTMISHCDMFLTLIQDIVLAQQYFQSILVYLFAKATTEFIMKQQNKSH